MFVHSCHRNRQSLGNTETVSEADSVYRNIVIIDISSNLTAKSGGVELLI